MDNAFKRNSWNLRQNSREMLQFCSITRSLLGKNYCFFKLHHIRISILLSFTDFLEMLRQWFVKNDPTVILPYFAQQRVFLLAFQSVLCCVLKNWFPNTLIQEHNQVLFFNERDKHQSLMNPSHLRPYYSLLRVQQCWFIRQNMASVPSKSGPFYLIKANSLFNELSCSEIGNFVFLQQLISLKDFFSLLNPWF